MKPRCPYVTTYKNIKHGDRWGELDRCCILSVGHECPHQTVWIDASFRPYSREREEALLRGS